MHVSRRGFDRFMSRTWLVAPLAVVLAAGSSSSTPSVSREPPHRRWPETGSALSARRSATNRWIPQFSVGIGNESSYNHRTLRVDPPRAGLGLSRKTRLRPYTSPECNLWCRRLGAGAPCPHRDELLVLSDILDAEQLVSQPHSRQRIRRSVSQPRV